MISSPMPHSHSKPRLSAVLAFAAGLWAIPAFGAITVTESWAVSTGIPDNDPAGVADTRQLSTAIISIDSVTVTLMLTESFAMWNGDYYAYLTYKNGFSVLLNRAGRTDSNPAGYGDAGFSLTFDDAANHDVHLYREIFIPDGILTGMWQPDARAVDPALAVDTSLRSANLASFNGLNPNGEWTLFVADLAAGGEAIFGSWSLTVTGQIPEPASNLLIILSLATLALRRDRLSRGL